MVVQTAELLPGATLIAFYFPDIAHQATGNAVVGNLYTGGLGHGRPAAETKIPKMHTIAQQTGDYFEGFNKSFYLGKTF
jgi:hypothetical protein